MFDGIVRNQNDYQITMELSCIMTRIKWYLTNIYGPAHNEDINDFFTWLPDFNSTQMKYWMLVGDFNLMIELDNRNRLGRDNNNMLLFNTVIEAHNLKEIPLKGRSYTWSNMKNFPLLERLDWVFTSTKWTTKFHDTLSFSLSRMGSDHRPIHIKIGTCIPSSNIFIF
jgi:hypothetical protein